MIPARFSTVEHLVMLQEEALSPSASSPILHEDVIETWGSRGVESRMDAPAAEPQRTFLGTPSPDHPAALHDEVICTMKYYAESSGLAIGARLHHTEWPFVVCRRLGLLHAYAPQSPPPDHPVGLLWTLVKSAGRFGTSRRPSGIARSRSRSSIAHFIRRAES